MSGSASDPAPFEHAVSALSRTPTTAELEALTGLFERYRGHYGCAADPAQSTRWLERHISSGLLDAFVVRINGEFVGFATTMDVPASLGLSHYWQIRDLFVVPARRRLGLARALLTHIRTAAISAGALRLALQTEEDNIQALRLYRRFGFVEGSGYLGLMLPLTDDGA